MRLLIALSALRSLLLPAAAAAKPANVEAAVASPQRPEADRKLDESRKPAQVLEFLELEQGDRVLDLFAGGGYFTEIMARAVGPDGFVIGQNATAFASRPQIQTAIGNRGYGKAIPNAAAMNVDFGVLSLAPESFDFALLNMVYHDLYWESEKYDFKRTDPHRVLAALYRGMKPGGIVGVVDHVGPAGDTRAIVDKLHRIDPATIRADFERAGFVLDAQSDMLRNPEDDHTKNVFDPAIRYKTDRVVYRFVKPAAETAADGAQHCDAAPAQDLVGQLLSDALREKAKAASGAKGVRVIRPGQAVTMEYRMDRLNILVDDKDAVTAVRCG
jgi:predicted methyltransferase